MHSRLKPHLLLFLCSCGYVFSLPLSDCPCPGGKWMPPFRASQLIYSEFPEDRARSLNLNRRESSAPNEIQGKAAPQQRNYPDYDIPSYSNEYASQSVENDDFYKYNGYTDYKDKEEQYDFTLESFELDPEVMNPPPPPEEEEEEEENVQSDEVHESTEPTTTQLEVPSTESPPPETKVRQIPVQGYPLNRTPVPVFRNPALPGIQPWPGMDRWKSVLAERELSNLQFMKPPPLGQAQTWARPIHRFRPRPTVIYL